MGFSSNELALLETPPLFIGFSRFSHWARSLMHMGKEGIHLPNYPISVLIHIIRPHVICNQKMSIGFGLIED